MSGHSIILVLLKMLMCLLLISQHQFAVAQIDPGQWVDDLFVVNKDNFPVDKILLDEKNVVHLTIPNIAHSIDFPIPHENRNLALWAFWRNDAFYTLASGSSEKREESDTVFFRHTFAKWNDNKWNFLGDYKTDSNEILVAIPCDNDRFIVISNSRDLTDNNRTNRSPFSRMSIHPSKTEIVLDTSIDYGSVMDEMQKYMLDPICFGLAYHAKKIITDKYAILLNFKTGLYWIFSLEKASLTASGMVFKKMLPEMIAKGGFSKAILCAHPEKNGTILLSALEEAAFMTESADTLKEINELLEVNPDLSTNDILKIMRIREEELALKNPLLVWYRIYPDNGRIEKVEPPIGAAYVRDGKSDMWRPMPDGSVQMGAFKYITDKVEQQKNDGGTEEKKLDVNHVENDKINAVQFIYESSHE